MMMKEYLIAYFGGKHETGEAGKKHMERWKQWLSELGEAVVDPGTPLKNGRAVRPDGTVDTEGFVCMSGFTRLKFTDEAEALAAAKSCPFLDIGGTLQVSEIASMKG